MLDLIDVSAAAGLVEAVAATICASSAYRLFLAILVVAGPLAYLLITSIDLREGIAALRARHPCAGKLLKALAHAVLFAKLLLL